jgi:hypothetical protein
MSKDKYLSDVDPTWMHSLSKITNRKIVDVIGFPSLEFGEPATFECCYVIFDNGEKLTMDGEHEIAYVYGDVLDSDLLQEIHDAEEATDEQDS